MMSAATPNNLQTLELKVAGMDCAECSQHVEQALTRLSGVAEAKVYLSSEKAMVRYDPARASLSTFRTAVEGAGYTLAYQTLELPIGGMDCAECKETVQHALAALPGVVEARVLLSSEKAIVEVDPSKVDLPTLRKAVIGAGYMVPQTLTSEREGLPVRTLTSFTRPILTLFGLVFGAVLLVVVAGEWLGLFERVTDLIPWYLGWGLVVLAGYPIFWNVIKASLRRQVISHTLMSLGVIAALVVGQWPTAVVIVFFMRVGDYAEHFTTERSRLAVKRLTALSPKTARVERNGAEQVVPIAQVMVGETVIVRPGEAIPVDGEVLSGTATINQAAITGESMPVEAFPGGKVYAATLAQFGSLRIQVRQVGTDTTFGRVIAMVVEAEAHRAPVQRIADRFSAYFLPVVATIAALTFVISRNPLSAAAVLVVACSCSFALATPIAMLASIGAAASRGLLVKGGKYLEALARADVVFIDKTGTVTAGRPQVTDIVPLADASAEEVLLLAASAERDSEHPLAEAVRQKANESGPILGAVSQFEAVPGMGVRAYVDGVPVMVGNARMMKEHRDDLPMLSLAQEGKTLLFVERGSTLIGVIAVADTPRAFVKEAIRELRAQGIGKIELLTGDNRRTAEALASSIGVTFQAELLPEDKIHIVKQAQEGGHTVVMIGDGVNDAPALAQADVGIAMGVMGTDIAQDAAHAALMREDWRLIPDLFTIARRTMRVVKTNLSFTILYNLVGLSLAAFGILPPILAAAAQSLPDLGILANSSRLLRQRLPTFSDSSPEGVQNTEGAKEPCGCGNQDCRGTTDPERAEQRTSPQDVQVLQLIPRSNWRKQS
jgi:Cd2+/Zn2+-exporting ATPase/Cu+-exporting ATPase